MADSLTHAMTVDVEDYFQVSGMDDRVSRCNWDRLESRVERSTQCLLALFDSHEIRATFFVLGWVAERYPGLVRRIVENGHEIASHGYWHKLIYTITPEEFARDISDSCDAIASACGVRPTAYRAPSFSITDRSLWALDILVEHGFEVDSSIFPIRGHHRYGVPDAKQELHDRKTEAGLIREYPPSIGSLAKAQLPIGGGYFRLLPLALTVRAINSIQNLGRPAMFYIHPWEVDPAQPRIEGLSRGSSFRHYVGLKRTESKLDKLIGKFSFGTMSDSMEGIQALSP